MANKEIYRIDIKIGVSGDSETQGKLSAMEKMAEQTKNKLKALDKIKASPSAKLKDDASTTIDKIKSRTNKLNGITAQVKVGAKDGASKVIDKIESKAEKLNNKSVKPKIDADNKAGKIIEKTENQAEKLNNKKATVKIKAQDEATKTINNVESKINGWIKTGAQKIISVGIAGVLATGGIGLGTSLKTFSQYEQGLSNVKAVTEATDKQMKQLGDTAKSLGASTTWSAVQVTEAEELLGQAGFSVQETITALPGLLSLASAGGLDLASATDIASGTLRAFSLNASDSAHVADVLALSAAATNSDVTDLGETMKYVAPVSASLGISLEDTAAAAGLLSNQNIKGSQAGTVLRQAMARLASPTEQAADVMKEYGINAFDAEGNMKPLSGVVDNLNTSLGKLTSQQRADAISTIFGTESMSGILALMNQGGESLGSLSQKLKDAKGSADKMAETKLDNLAGQWEQLTGAVETAQIELGERLAPYAKEFVTWLTGKMPEITDSVVKFVDYISKNTTTIKTLAATVVGLSAAFAGFSAVGKIGNTITGIKGLASVLKGGNVAEETVKVAGGLRSIGAVGRLLPLILNPVGLAIAGTAVVAGTAIIANANLMKKSLSTTTEELSTTEKIMNKLNGSIYKSKKEMSKLGLVYDDFGNGISDSFKTAARDASKSLLEIEMNIQRLVRDGSIDDADNTQLKGWVDKFTNEAIEAIRQKQSEIQSEFQKTFSLDGVTSDAEQNVMDYLSSYFEEGVNKELAIRDEIYSIGDKAIKDHGAILDSDIKQIRDKLAELKSLQLEYANAESAGERAYSSSKFTSKVKDKAESTAGTVAGIKDASQLLQDRAKEYQSQRKEVEANYDKTIATTKYLLSSPKISSETKTELEAGLKETTAARDKALKEAKESWKSDLETVYKYYPNAKGKINKYDGAELTGGDIKTQGSLEKIKNKYSQLKNITQSGFYSIRNSATGEMNAMYISVEKSTGDIVGAWNVTTGEIGAYTTEIKSQVKELGNVHQSTIGGAIKYISDMGASYDTANNRIVSSSGEAIGKIKQVITATDGTRTIILDLNNTPIQITSNAEGTITELQGVTDSINLIPSSKTISLRATFTQEQIDYGIADASRFLNQNAAGTNYFSGGLSTVDERGWELSQNKPVSILGKHNGNPLTYMPRGTKIFNHMQSVNDMKEEVSAQVNQRMAEFTGKPTYMANGGITSGPEISVRGEAGAEAVIPLSNSRRSRGLQLWQQAGRMLGVRMFADGGIVGSGSTGTDKVAKATANISTSVAIGDDALSQFKKYGNKINDNLSSGILDNRKVSTDSVNRVTNESGSVLNLFSKTGHVYGGAAMNDFAQGISAATSNVTGAVKTLTNKVIEEFKSGFGIHSPSRVMYKLAQYLPQGFINGLTSTDVGGFIKNWIGSMVSVAGGAVSGNLSGWITAAMALTGVGADWFSPLATLIQYESGGDPMSINLWDSNAAAGHPSKGLMQLIDENMQDWHLPGMTNIWDPVSNIAAGIRLILHDYGSIYNVPGIRALASGGAYVGYATGTDNAAPGLARINERGWEFVDFTGGEQVLTHNKSVGLMERAANSINRIKNAVSGLNSTGTENKDIPENLSYYTSQPQVAMVGTSYGDINIDVENNFSSDPDIDEIVIQATKKFATELKKQLQNIKR